MSKIKIVSVCGAAVVLAALTAHQAAAIAVGQLENFSVDLGGWTQGRPPSGGVGLTREATGGPAGDGDAYMQIVADFTGSQRTIIAFNLTPAWTGDYLTAGVSSIGMSVRNLGMTDLQLRLALGTGVIPDLPGSWLASTQAVDLPAGAGWTSVNFPLDEAALTLVQDAGGADYQTVMSSVAAVRLLHVETPSIRGTSVVGALGVDNIRAVPEPQSAALFAVGMWAVRAGLRRRAAR